MPKDDMIHLTWAEVLLAATVGVMRSVQDKKEGRGNRFGCSEKEEWQVSIDGAIAEMAFAKWSGKFWSGAIGNLKARDVGGFQVRSVRDDGRRLILHPTDDDDDIFVLMTGFDREWRVSGFIQARFGKNEDYWQDPTGRGRHAYFVPRGVLLHEVEL